MQLDGMGQGTKLVGKGGTVSHPSVGLQGEGQFDTAEFLPAIADDHPDAVVAVGHPGRELHIGHIEVTGWQGVGALWGEGTDRQEVNQKPSPAPKGTVVPTGPARVTAGAWPYRFEGAVAGNAVGQQGLRAGRAGWDEFIENAADVVVGAAAQLVDAGQLDPEVTQCFLYHQHCLEGRCSAPAQPARAPTAPHQPTPSAPDHAIFRVSMASLNALLPPSPAFSSSQPVVSLPPTSA